MKVLHVAAGNLWGGVESLLETLAFEQRSVPELEQHFAVAFEGRLFEQLQIYAPKFPARPNALSPLLGPARLSRPWTVVRARRKLRELLSHERPDAAFVHGAWPHAVFGPTLAGEGVPVVAYVHDIVRGHWLERLATRTHAGALVANSAFTLEAAKPYFPGVPSSVVHPAVTLTPGWWTTDIEGERPSMRAKWRAEIGTEDTAMVLLIACRLERWKGHALLLEALTHLRNEKTWRLWIAGGAQRPHEVAYLKELEEIAKRLGLAERVKFLGQRRDVTELLNAADILCQPNTAPEPFGVAFVEALAAGKPVVTTAIGGALEVVDASCGILVEPDAGAVASALGRLIGDPKERAHLGAAGPARAKLLSDPEARLKDLLEVARSVVAQGVKT